MDRLDCMKRTHGRRAAAPRWLLLLCVLMLTMGTLRGLPVKAAEVEVTLTLSAEEVQVGDWVEAELIFTSDTKLAGVYAHITYDPAVLEYSGGDPDGRNGRRDAFLYAEL